MITQFVTLQQACEMCPSHFVAWLWSGLNFDMLSLFRNPVIVGTVFVGSCGGGRSGGEGVGGGSCVVSMFIWFIFSLFALCLYLRKENLCSCLFRPICLLACACYAESAFTSRFFGHHEQFM